MKGLVMKSTGSWYLVKAETRQYQCRVKGKLRLKGFKTTNPIAVGDWVQFDKESSDKGIIYSIVPRNNFITRKSPNLSKEAHTLAANIDQAILMATVVYPRTSFGFIDRFTVTTESYRIPTIVIFNKIDILDKELIKLQQEMIDTYIQAGYNCFSISALKNRGLGILEEMMEGKINLLAGHSGVGKSTLINHLSEDINQKVAEVSNFSQKGVHTTTFAEMFEVGSNTFIIDTPGIKEFGLSDIQEFELSDYFPEMRRLRGKCKYYDCRHIHEPKCAVIEAVNSGSIANTRYYSYLSMLENEDNRG